MGHFRPPLPLLKSDIIYARSLWLYGLLNAGLWFHHFLDSGAEICQICFAFLENLWHPKDILKLTDLRVMIIWRQCELQHSFIFFMKWSLSTEETLRNCSKYTFTWSSIRFWKKNKWEKILTFIQHSFTSFMKPRFKDFKKDKFCCLIFPKLD